MDFDIKKDNMIDFGKDGHIQMQNGTVLKHGHNGATIVEVATALIDFICKLNAEQPSTYNFDAVTNLNNIINEMYLRYMDRTVRKVEGKNEK